MDSCWNACIAWAAVWLTRKGEAGSQGLSIGRVQPCMVERWLSCKLLCAPQCGHGAPCCAHPVEPMCHVAALRVLCGVLPAGVMMKDFESHHVRT